MNRIRVVIFEPGKPGREDYIPDSEKAMERVVGGQIQSGLLTLNTRIVYAKHPKQREESRFGISGTCFVAGEEDGRPGNLSRQQVDFLLGYGGANHGEL